jgi:hypothetical protein
LEVVYLDTAGTGFDTVLFVTDASGNAISAMCNDDASCSTGGFTSIRQSRVARILNAGTYYVSVGGYNGATGSFALHIQLLPTEIGSYFYDTPLDGDSSTATYLLGSSRISSICGGAASGEDVRWWVSCGNSAPGLFSLCASDGGSYTRQSGPTSYDPALQFWTGQLGGVSACNDDGGAAYDCRGTGVGADSANYGSRLTPSSSRGLNAIIVDERTGGSGMTYTLRYTVP